MRQLVYLIAVIALPLGGSKVLADGKNPTFADDITPIFRQHCHGCHGNDKQKGGLNLATYVELQKGGSSGSIVTPGNPDKSRLFMLVDHREEPKMPSSSQKIPAEQIGLIKLWIEQGVRENSGSNVNIPVMPKTDIGLKSVVKGRPDGPPPMPIVGKLRVEPVVTARRPGAVLALATSPWAPLAAVGGQKQVILYNTDSGVLLGVIPFEHGQINSIKFSRNGRFILVAGGRGGLSGKAVLYNVDTGEKVVEIGNETDAVLAADISADQTQIAVGGPSKVVRVYSTLDGTVLREIKKHTDWVTAIEYSPDGVLLATGDRNGGLFVWESFTGREYFSLRGHTAMITDLSWRDDSNVLASSSEDTTVKLWEMENGNNIKNWGAHAGGAASVRFTHDGKIASTGRDKVTKLWDQNGAIQKQFDPFPDLGLRVAVTHENAKVIGGDWSGIVKTWNVADAKIVATADTNPLPLAERLKQADAAFAAATAKVAHAQASFDAATAKVKQATDAYNSAFANANKINADLAAAMKAVMDFTNAANSTKPVMDAAKAEVNKFTQLAVVPGNKVAALEVAIAAETTAAKAIADAAAKAPQNNELASLAKKATDNLAALNNELIAAKKAATDNATALAAATAKFTAASKAYNDAVAMISTNQKSASSLAPMVKPATDAVSPAKAALDAANSAIAPTKAALEAANADVTRAKTALDSLKASTVQTAAPATPAQVSPQQK
jgi:hypothetical protein